MTNLHVEGPFEISCESNGKIKRVRTSDGSEFWQRLDVSHLRSKQGCYIFATRAGPGFTPWYIGRASKGFKQEIFVPHKRERYNTGLFWGRTGTPVMFFVTLPGTRQKVPVKVLADMERELIQYAVAKNPDLCNVQHTKNLPQWSIRGVIRSGQGKPSKVAKQFSTMLGM